MLDVYEQRHPQSGIPFTNRYGMMRTTAGNKEQHAFRKPEDFRSVHIHLTAEAVGWLCGTTTDDDGREISNFTLFGGLLARMAIVAGEGKGFRRPQYLKAGQFQYSETALAAEWNMGRKKARNLLGTMERMGLLAVRHSRTASVAALACVAGWTDDGGNDMDNPSYHPTGQYRAD